MTSRLGVSSKVLREAIEEANRKWEENKAQRALNSTQSMIKFLLNQRNQYHR